MDPGREVRVVQGEFPLRAQNEVSQVVGGIEAFFGLSADGDRLPVGIALVERAAGLREVEVDVLSHGDPEAFEQFFRLVFIDGAFFQVGFIVGVQVLVHPPVGDDGAGLLLDPGEELDEPLALDRLMEGLRRFCGNFPTNAGGLQEFRFPLRVRFLFRFGSGQVRMAIRPEDDRVCGQNDRFQEGLPLSIVDGAELIESCEFLFRLFADAFEADPQGLFVVMDPLDRGTEGCRLVDDEAGRALFILVISVFPGLCRNGSGQVFVEGLSLPVRGDDVDDVLGIFRLNVEGRTLPGRKAANGFI